MRSRKRLLLLEATLFSILATTTEAQICQPCGSIESEVSKVKHNLEEAFRISLDLPDCRGPQNLEGCRSLERLLTEAFTSLQAIEDGIHAEGTSQCLVCDPGPILSPVLPTFEALASLLEQKGFEEFAPVRSRTEKQIEEWKTYRCCEVAKAAGDSGGARDREADARLVLTEKCGLGYVENRRGLRQIVRIAGERVGCYQSRACQKSSSQDGVQIQGGFRTYDGEYWYIWAERLSPQGDWTACEP